MRIFVIWDLVAPAVRTLVEALPELWPRLPGQAEDATDAGTIDWCIPGVTAAGKEMARDVIIAGVRGADHVIALLDRPSASVGWQVGLALGWGKSLQLASIGAELPSWTQVGALKGLFTHHLNDVTAMRALLQPLLWQLPAIPEPDSATGGAQTLVLCPGGPIGSTLREVALRDRNLRALPDEGWGLYELPQHLAQLTRAVWVLASDGRGAAQELADNASNGVVAGFAEARGLAVAVLRADDVPIVVDVQPREHRFRGLPQFKQKLQTVCGVMPAKEASAVAWPITTPSSPVTPPVVEKKPRSRFLIFALLPIVGIVAGGVVMHLRGRHQPAPMPPPSPIAAVPVARPVVPDLGAPPVAVAVKPASPKSEKSASSRTRRSAISPDQAMAQMSGLIGGFMPAIVDPNAPQVAEAAPTSAWPPKSTGCTLTDAEVKAMMSETKRQSYGDQWAFLAEATQTRCLTVKQLRTVLHGFPRHDDSLRVLRWIGPRVRDPQNAFLLEDKLTYREEQQACQSIFGCCQARCATPQQ